jgi:hypothetical protein
LLRKRVPFGHKRRHIPTGSHWHAGNKMLILPKNSATVLLPQGGFLTLLLNVGNGGMGCLFNIMDWIFDYNDPYLLHGHLTYLTICFHDHDHYLLQ